MPNAQEIFKYIVGKVSEKGADLRLEDTSEDKEFIENLIGRWKKLNISKESNTSKKAEEKDKHNKQMFQSILSDFCELILKYENNGNAQDHVEKLNYLFHNSTSAARWLFEYSLHTDSTAPLHDLCLNIIKNMNTEPNPLVQNQNTNQQIDNDNDSDSDEDEETPQDGPIVAQSNILPRVSSMPPLYIFGEGNLTRMFKDMIILRTVTQYHPLITKNKNEWSKTPMDDLVKEIKDDLEKNELTSLGIDLDKLSEEEKNQLKKIQEYNIRFKFTKYRYAKIILETLQEAKNSDLYLPSIIMTSESTGLSPGYYFTKLKQNDVRNLMAGYFTGCCQHISGQGKKCAIHSVTSEFGATYALMKGKIEDGKTRVNLERDTPIAVSWTWASFNPNKQKVVALGFDSIEFDNRMIDTLVIDNKHLDLTYEEIFQIIYSEAANLMLQSNPDLQKVVVGTHGRTPSEVGYFPVLPEDLELVSPWVDSELRFEGYRDSRNQLILASRNYPDFYRVHRLNFDTLIPQLCKSHDEILLNALCLNHENLANAEIKLSAWIRPCLLGHFSDALMQMPDSGANLSVFLPCYQKTIAMCFISRGYIDQKILNNLTKEDLNVGSVESTVLIEAIKLKNIKLLELLLDKGGDPNLGDSDGNTFVHHLFMRTASDAKILSNIPVEWVNKYNFNMTLVNDKRITPLNTLAIPFYDLQSDNPLSSTLEWLDLYSNLVKNEAKGAALKLKSCTTMKDLDNLVYSFYPVKEWVELLIPRIFELLKTEQPSKCTVRFALQYLHLLNAESLSKEIFHDERVVNTITQFLTSDNQEFSLLYWDLPLIKIENTLSLLNATIIPIFKNSIKKLGETTNLIMLTECWNQGIRLLENDPDKDASLQILFNELMRYYQRNKMGYFLDNNEKFIIRMSPGLKTHAFETMLSNYIIQNPVEVKKLFSFHFLKDFYAKIFEKLDIDEWPNLYRQLFLSSEDMTSIIRKLDTKVSFADLIHFIKITPEFVFSIKNEDSEFMFVDAIRSRNDLALSFNFFDLRSLDEYLNKHRSPRNSVVDKVRTYVPTLNDLNLLLIEIEGADKKDLIRCYVRLVNLPNKEAISFCRTIDTHLDLYDDNQISLYTRLLCLFTPGSVIYQYMNTESSYTRNAYESLLNVKDKKNYDEISRLLSSHLVRIQAHFDAAQPQRGFTPTILEYKLMKAIQVIDLGNRSYFEPDVKDEPGSSRVSLTIW